MANKYETTGPDASIARMMHECANEEGAVLLESFSRTESPELPGELDEKCRTLIEKDFSRKQRRVVTNHVIRSFCGVLLCLFGLLGVGTVTALSVESIRTPVVAYFENYFVRQTDGEMHIHGLKKPTEPSSAQSSEQPDSDQPLNQETHMGIQVRGILEEVVPKEYVLAEQSGFFENTVIAIYNREDGRQILVSIHSLDSSTKINTEGAELIEEFDFHGCAACWIIDYDNDEVSVHWIDEERWTLFHILSNALTQEEVLNLAEQFVTRLNE